MKRQAMIFAAGLGTRLRPLTDTLPKALVPVDGQPLLWHVLTKLRREGYGRVVVNVHHRAQQVVDYLAATDFGLDIAISDESDCLLETGGAIKHARHLFDPSLPVLIHNVDILSNADLGRLTAAFMPESDTGTTGATDTTTAVPDALLLVSQRQTTRYLLFAPADQHLVGWTNTATGQLRGPIADAPARVDTCARYAFSGIHAIHPRLFGQMDCWPDRFSIIDFYLDVCRRHHVVACPDDRLRLLDVGKPDALARADTFLQSITP